jgi:hypothetical protein
VAVCAAGLRRELSSSGSLVVRFREALFEDRDPAYGHNEHTADDTDKKENFDDFRSQNE